MKKIVVLSLSAFILFSCAKTEEVDDSDFSKISLELEADKSSLKVGDTLNLYTRYRNEYNVRKQVVPVYTFVSIHLDTSPQFACGGKDFL